MVLWLSPAECSCITDDSKDNDRIFNAFSKMSDEGGPKAPSRQAMKTWLRRAQERIKELETQVQRQADDLEAKTARIQTLEWLVTASTQPQDVAALEAEVARLREENSRLADDSEVQRRLEATAAELSRLRATHSQVEDEFQQFKSKAGRLKTHLKKLQQENDRLSQIQEESLLLRQELTEKASLIRSIQEQHLESQQRLKASADRVRELEAEVRGLKKSHFQTEGRLNSERHHKKELSETLRRQDHEMNEMDRTLTSFETELRANRAELDELRRKATSHQTEVLELTRQRNDFRRRMDEAELQRRQIVLAPSRQLVFEVAFEKVKRPKEPTVSATYLQKLLVQFCGQSTAGRVALLPVLLRCVGCQETDIQTAIREWRGKDRVFKWF
jgi:chromosome segregation ATPase